MASVQTTAADSHPFGEKNFVKRISLKPSSEVQMGTTKQRMRQERRTRILGLIDSRTVEKNFEENKNKNKERKKKKKKNKKHQNNSFISF